MEYTTIADYLDLLYHMEYTTIADHLDLLYHIEHTTIVLPVTSLANHKTHLDPFGVNIG